MIGSNDNTVPSAPGMKSWENEGGSIANQDPRRDLNYLLAQEQTSIMNAEAADDATAYEMHRNASIDTRRLINASPYPEHERHVFARERAAEAEVFHESFARLISFVEESERLLSSQYAEGTVSAKSFQNRTRFLRQDRAKVTDASIINRSENIL